MLRTCPVANGHRYFERVEALLRRSLGVSLTAKGSAFVRPAPPTAMGPLSEEGVGDDQFVMNAEDLGENVEWVDWQKVKEQAKHDEL